MMKTTWKNLLIIPLLLALAAVPAIGQQNTATNNETNSAASVSSPPPSPEDQTATNQSSAKHKKSKDSEDNTQVRIDGTGIHVGGEDPVDINLPHFSQGEDHSVAAGAFVVGVVSIVVPFFFLGVMIGCAIYFKYRRNRTLHETLRTMIDKGVPIPPELVVPPGLIARRRTGTDLRNGMVMLAIGAGIMIFSWRWGLIPALIGVAFLITWKIEKSEEKNNSGSTIK